MKFTTLRNLMASMLVLGVAASVIGVGSGTFAVFNAVTENPTNTFATGDLIFQNAVNGGAFSCTAQSSGTTPNTCTTVGSISSNMIPGDSKLGTVRLKNNSTSTGMTVTGNVSATTTSFLDSTALGSGGLGFLVFRCETSGGAARPCTGNGAATTTLRQIYPTTGTCTTSLPVTAGADVATSDVSITSTSTTNITVGGQTCTGGNIIPASAFNVNGFNTVNGVTSAIAAGNIVDLAVVVYLPGNAVNGSAAKGPSVLKYSWTANQVLGTSQ